MTYNEILSAAQSLRFFVLLYIVKYLFPAYKTL